MSPELQKKVDRAIRLLQHYDKAEPIEVCYSGGKDSDVILELVKMSGIPYRAIYKNTTIDPPGTIAHAKEMGAEILQPKMTFFELIAKNGGPTRFSRFCCRVLKEYKVLDKSVQGVRRSESRARAQRYKEPTECRLYGKKEHVEVFYPILDWTNEDVAEFVAERGIKCHPLYYDGGGQFHPERRLGCIGCPLMSQKKRREQFKEYPKMLKLWIKNYSKYWDNAKAYKTKEKFESPYDVFFFALFCTTMVEYNSKKYNLFGTLDTKKYLEEYFNIEL